MNTDHSVFNDDIVLRSIGIGVSDLARSADFYSRICGMTEVARLKLDVMDEIILSYSPDGRPSRGSRLVLMHWTDGSSPNYRNNAVKLVFGVTDAKTVIERIRAAGFPIIREAGKSQAGNSVVGFAKDPNGYVLEILQAGK